MVTGQLDVRGLVDQLEKKVFDALDEAVDETVVLGVAYAKRLAPVRKVTYLERNKKTRILSSFERQQLPKFARGDPSKPLRTTVRRSRQTITAPEVEEFDGGFRLKNRDDESALTYRGRQELRESGRWQGDETTGTKVNLATGKVTTTRKPRTTAIYTRGIRTANPSGKGQAVTGTKSTLGGRLRGEIRGDKLPVSRGRITYEIVSPTPYARFVELPTSRTAAQPYMRPTLKYLKGPFKTRVFRSLKKRGFQIDPV